MKTHEVPEPTSGRSSRTGPREETRDKYPRRRGRRIPEFDSTESSMMSILLANPRRPKKGPGKDIKSAYRLTLMTGLVLSLGVMITLMRADITRETDERGFELAQQEVVQFEEIEQTRQELKAPPPPRPPIPVEVPNDVVFDDVELDLDVTLDLNAEAFDIPPPPPAPAMEEPEEEIEIFVVVEQMPQIIGGNQKVYEYLAYPEIARQAGIEGMVVVQIVVDPEGIPRDPVTARSAGDVLDEAAVQAVMKLRFIPGRQRGKAVSVRLAIPIRFRIRDAQN